MLVSNDRAVWLASHVLPHEPALRAWLRHKGTLPFDIEDLVQEAYAVLAELPSVDHIRNPKAYLFQTAHSLALQQLRRARLVSIRAVADVDRLEAALEVPSTEHVASDQEELQRLADAIAALPRQCGEVFRLRKIEGLSQREVAGRLRLAESTVEKHVAKAVRILMDVFARTRVPAPSTPSAGAAQATGERES